MPTQVDWAPDTSEEGQQACAIPCAGLASRTKQNQAGFISDKLGLLAAAARVVDADAVSKVEAKHKLVDAARTGQMPDFLYMDEREGKEKSLVWRAAQLGIIQERGMLRADLDEYITANIFVQEEQDISRERKKSAAAKRKEEFAASQTEEKREAKRNRKSALSGKVRRTLGHTYYHMVAQM
jgi:hypothetical protein